MLFRSNKMLAAEAKTRAGPRHRIETFYNGFRLWGFKITCGSYVVVSLPPEWKTPSAALRAARAWAAKWLRSREVTQ